MRHVTHTTHTAIASGHYAKQRINEHDGSAQLIMSPDRIKDQTYFLCNMDQRQLSHARFPLGGLDKSEVRATLLSMIMCASCRRAYE